MKDILLRPGQVSLAEWREIHRGARAALDPACSPVIERSAAAVAAIVAKRAPLAQLAATMIGVGEIFVAGERIPAEAALAHAGLVPLTLGPKEGLALLNGTQFSTATALAGLFEAENLFRTALVTGALSTDAAKGSDAPFDRRIHLLRGHRGQIEAADALRDLMAGSPIPASHLLRDELGHQP